MAAEVVEAETVVKVSLTILILSPPLDAQVVAYMNIVTGINRYLSHLQAVSVPVAAGGWTWAGVLS